MKILLLQPEQIYYERRRTPYFPIGLGYIAAVLIKNKYAVEVLDLNATPKTGKQLSEYLKEKKFDVIGISAMSVQYNYVENIVNIIRKVSRKSLIVLGGALAIHSYKIVLENLDIDFCALGEGETILLSLLKNLDEPGEVKGIAYAQNKKIIITSKQEDIKDLDSLPFPAWDLFAMGTYMKYNNNTVNLISARGCPFNCNFCSKNFKGVRLRSVKNVIAEIKVLKKKFKTNYFAFDDELVVVNEKRIAELCGEIKKLGIKWSCQGRINFSTKPILSMMKDAGCSTVGFGIESGSPKILKNMNKGITPEMIITAIKNCDAIRLNYVPQMIFGYVGEDEDSLKETLKLCFKTGMTPAFNTATPYPGTQLYEWAKKAGKIKDELKYLQGLQGNVALYVNCSTFPDKDFDRIKRKFEKKILYYYFLYTLAHPSRLINDNKAKLNNLHRHIKANGVRKTFSEFIRAIRKYPQLVFGRY